MVIFWAASAIVATAFVLSLIYRSARRRRESLVLAFTERIGISVTAPIIDVVDRRIRDRFFGFTLGGLAALFGMGFVFLANPEFLPTGLAGFATSGILVAAMATGAAVSALRQFALPRGSDASRVARLDAPTLADYVHPAWVWTSGSWAVVAVALTASLFLGNLRTDAETGRLPLAGGLPLAGVVVLAALTIGGVACAALLSRRLLAIPQPASDELELQWDDALRAYALRDIWVASIGLGAATTVAASSWILEGTSPFYFAATLIGIAPFLLFGFPPSKRSSRRLWQPVSAEI